METQLVSETGRADIQVWRRHVACNIKFNVARPGDRVHASCIADDKCRSYLPDHFSSWCRTTKYVLTANEGHVENVSLPRNVNLSPEGRGWVGNMSIWGKSFLTQGRSQKFVFLEGV